MADSISSMSGEPSHQRTNDDVSVDLPQELVDSDNEDFLCDDPDPDDNSIVGKDDFDLLASGAEQAKRDRMWQFCTVGTPEGEEEDHCINKGDTVVQIKDLEPDVNIPGIPPNHQPMQTEVDAGEVPFDKVDNPGNWSDYFYCRQFDDNSQYTGHFLPAGAKPVPLSDGNKKRTCNGWEFHYSPWENKDSTTSFRSGASTKNMFPESRKGSLNSTTLKKLGLTKERMEKADALFFYQLIYPICDPKRSGIEGDPRKAYYFDVGGFTSKYAVLHGYGSPYAPPFEPMYVWDLVVFHGILVRDGVHGGSKGAIYRRWDPTTSCYDPEIAQAMSLYRWRQIKKVFKLNDIYDNSGRRDSPTYNPAHKFDLAYRVIVENCNSLTLHAELDQCADEMTWKLMGYGDGKNGVTKGGQLVLTTDASRCRPRAYLHRHNLHHRPQGCGDKRGPNEVRLLVDKLSCMISKENGDARIFREAPHITLDDFFSGDEIMDHIGRLGFAATIACRPDRLPLGVPKFYFHHEKVLVDDRSKATRLIQPITAVKSFPKDDNNKAYQRTHVSFQSAGPTNISTVNALNTNQLLIHVKEERGVGKKKRKRGVEMNNGRLQYLSHCRGVHNIDRMISDCCLQYRSRKYWHSPMLQALALAIVTAYDLYLESASGSLDPVWQLQKPMSFHQFRDRLSSQMLSYKPKYNRYPGDEAFGSHSPPIQKVRTKTDAEPSKRSRKIEAAANGCGKRCIMIDGLEATKKTKRPRVVYHHADLSKHLKSFLEKKATISSGAKCVWCNEKAYTRCTICGVPLHNFPAKGVHKGKSCSVDWHNANASE
ncbi:unnamed protein product [Cylindrotheca closterium]|uniref:PiggyBac transposable element-derived protein domain-containing protein n=1 Tax=Cylindrotheca closterium TaxID=2856 RepID=A0AAD2FF88_9STRA|nr:unnamed protein product [Cylindrotheca closterium]